MAFECDDCHQIATGNDLMVHFSFSFGKCETCGQRKECADCQCQGDWAKARAERRDD